MLGHVSVPWFIMSVCQDYSLHDFLPGKPILGNPVCHLLCEASQISTTASLHPQHAAYSSMINAFTPLSSLPFLSLD